MKKPFHTSISKIIKHLGGYVWLWIKSINAFALAVPRKPHFAAALKSQCSHEN